MRIAPLALFSALALAPALLSLGACAAPGVELHPAEQDFAFVEVQLHG